MVTIQTNLEILNNLNYGLAYKFIGENTNVNTVNLCSNINLTETDFFIKCRNKIFCRESFFRILSHSKGKFNRLSS